MGLVARGCMYCEGECNKECLPKVKPKQSSSVKEIQPEQIWNDEKKEKLKEFIKKHKDGK
jgi:hypothetical protein